MAYHSSTTSCNECVPCDISAASFLYEGTQKSFISQKLEDSLNVQPCEQQNICLSSFGGTATPTKLQATHVYL